MCYYVDRILLQRMLFYQSSLFPMQKVKKVISGIDEADMSDLHRRNTLTMNYNLHGLQCHSLTGECGSRIEIHINASPLYIVGATQLANYNGEAEKQKHSHAHNYTHINIYLHAQMCTYTCTHTYTFSLHLCLYVLAYVHPHTSVIHIIHIQTYRHLHVHIHINTYTSLHIGI